MNDSVNPPGAFLDRGFRVGGCAVEPALCRIVRAAGQETRVEPRAMDVLVALARRAGDTVSRDDLIEAVWKHPHVSDEALSRCISMLRQALGDDRAQPRFVETIPKRGYRLIAPVEVAAGPASTDTTLSLAVLPFLNLSGDPAEEHVADGITELLISNLACLPPLRVISRTSSMHYKGTRARLTEIAAELGVSRIVEGSVLRSSQQLQVVVQLIDPTTDMHLFTRTYTRALTDVLRLQNEIAWTIGDEIGATLRPGDCDRPSSARPLAEDAVGAYLRARHFWNQRTADGFVKAIREYEACLAIEPDFAPACAGLADTFIMMALYDVMPPASLHARAKELAQRALALDGASCEALTANAAVALFFEWNLDAGERGFMQALAVNPSYDIARLGLANALMICRDFDAGLRELHLALRVNPFDLGLLMNVGEFLIWARRYDEAVAQLQRTLDIGPHFWPARCPLAEALALRGDGAAAKQLLAHEDIPALRKHQSLAFVHALQGERAQALASLHALEEARKSCHVPAAAIARGYAALAEVTQAVDWIDIGIEERSPWLLALGINPGYDRIRDDPAFHERLARIGVAE